MPAKSKATKEKEAIAKLTSSWQLKNYGNTISEESYVNHYKVMIDDGLQVLTLTGSASLPKSFAQYQNGTFFSSVSIPVGWDMKDPESEDNKVRLDHAIMLRDRILEDDLGKMEELMVDKYNENK